jgi:Flp pilus assembly protein TadD
VIEASMDNEPIEDQSAHAFSRGLTALRHEEFEAAIRLLEEATRLAPTDASAVAYLSSAYLAVGRPAEASAAVDRALLLDPDGFAPRLKAGELHLRLGDLGSAERQLLAAVRAANPGSPELVVARRWLAITRERLRQSIARRALLPRRPTLTGLSRIVRRNPKLVEEQAS